MSQQNFKILKSYIKKGLLDILDRDGGRMGRAGSDDGDKSLQSHPGLRKG